MSGIVLVACLFCIWRFKFQVDDVIEEIMLIYRPTILKAIKHVILEVPDRKTRLLGKSNKNVL